MSQTHPEYPWLFILAIAIFLISLVVLWIVGKRQKALGLPAGRIIIADTRQWVPVQKALYDPDSGLTGRPDYLVEQSGKLIPVEVKSQRVEAGPYDAHIFQLAAYCLLVERLYNKRPEFGILHYQNRTYEIEYTSQLESELLLLLEEMRLIGRKKTLDRSHESFKRCLGCGYRSTCDQRLL
jgi:CRISPR-associated exonuclease Cas4